MKSKNISGSNLRFYNDDKELKNCPKCKTIDSLYYGIREEEVDDILFTSLLIEGLICSKCDEIFMSLIESARVLNEKARIENTGVSYVVDGNEIVEVNLQ